MQARYYDPMIGCFLSIDPLGQPRFRPPLPPHMRNTLRQPHFKGDYLV